MTIRTHAAPGLRSLRLIAVIAALCAVAGAPAAARQELQGPARDVGLVDLFAADRASEWEAAHGANVAGGVQFGRTLPGVATDLLHATPRIVSRADHEASHNWFALKRRRRLSAGLPPDFDGFRVTLGSGGQAQWWISMALTGADGRTYSTLVTDSILPSGRIVEFLLPLGSFRAEGAPLTPAAVRTASGIQLAFSVPGVDLYLSKITVYRRSRLSGWLTLTTSRPAHNLFQPNEPVELRFAPGGVMPPGATGFRWQIRDFDDRPVGRGHADLDGRPSVAVPIPSRRSGYYEVRAWFTDRSGRDLGPDSCIRAEGSVPEGIGTFAVLPSTIAANRARFARLGRTAFLGLHGDFMGLADRIGLAWRFGYDKWPWLEPERPDRSSGIAPWASRRLAEPPQPPYALHILPFRGNMGEEVPAWARGPEGAAPPFARWDDYLAMVRDCVRIEKRAYPAMRPRLYGCAWEANLNMPPYSACQPPHTPAQLVELFRRTRETIKAEDPGGLILGPCPSVLQTSWFQTMFEAGALRWIDAIETHGYSDGAFDPEENDYPGKIARINALARKHVGGPLDIYCTELGLPGILGAEVISRSQARRMVRTAVILKGEGVRVLLPFYGIDYDRLGYWGFLYNRDIDAPGGPWATRRVAPKHMVTAMAACALLLEGAAPERRITDLGPGVWAYAFRRPDARITAVWAPGTPRTVRLPVRSRRASLLDIEGHPLPPGPVTRGRLTVIAGPSVTWLIEPIGSAIRPR